MILKNSTWMSRKLHYILVILGIIPVFSFVEVVKATNYTYMCDSVLAWYT